MTKNKGLTTKEKQIKEILIIIPLGTTRQKILKLVVGTQNMNRMMRALKQNKKAVEKKKKAIKQKKSI